MAPDRWDSGHLGGRDERGCSDRWSCPRRNRGRAHRVEVLQRGARALGSASGMTIDQSSRVHRARRGARYPIDLEPWLLDQPIQNSPGEGAVRAAALQRKIDEQRLAARDLGFGCRQRSRLSWLNKTGNLAVEPTMAARLSSV